ncbi:uncharacterized protein [Symphalangus syndactylus]|uniref:uncharacterized protein n=1 Tax=Symphalangus syndactylus TaxID=9590 RepID=UPI0024411469|nr:uncharacterized protein LOC129467490 [Symphalangus syndactylus]
MVSLEQTPLEQTPCYLGSAVATRCQDCHLPPPAEPWSKQPNADSGKKRNQAYLTSKPPTDTCIRPEAPGVTKSAAQQGTICSGRRHPPNTRTSLGTGHRLHFFLGAKCTTVPLPTCWRQAVHEHEGHSSQNTVKMPVRSRQLGFLKPRAKTIPSGTISIVHYQRRFSEYVGHWKPRGVGTAFSPEVAFPSAGATLPQGPTKVSLG